MSQGKKLKHLIQRPPDNDRRDLTLLLLVMLGKLLTLICKDCGSKKLRVTILTTLAIIILCISIWLLVQNPHLGGIQ